MVIKNLEKRIIDNSVKSQ